MLKSNTELQLQNEALQAGNLGQKYNLKQKSEILGNGIPLTENPQWCGICSCNIFGHRFDECLV